MQTKDCLWQISMRSQGDQQIIATKAIKNGTLLSCVDKKGRLVGEFKLDRVLGYSHKLIRKAIVVVTT